MEVYLFRETGLDGATASGAFNLEVAVPLALISGMVC